LKSAQPTTQHKKELLFLKKKKQKNFAPLRAGVAPARQKNKKINLLRTHHRHAGKGRHPRLSTNNEKPSKNPITPTT
jgi:hypothetical protein